MRRLDLILFKATISCYVVWVLREQCRVTIGTKYLFYFRYFKQFYQRIHWFFVDMDSLNSTKFLASFTSITACTDEEHYIFELLAWAFLCIFWLLMRFALPNFIHMLVSNNMMWKAFDLRSDLAWSSLTYHSQAVWPWANHVTSLILILLVGRIWIITFTSASFGIVKRGETA